MSIDADVPETTEVADITQVDTLSENRYDCIICSHVLHSVGDLERGVTGHFRMLKLGGALIVTVPMISMCDPKYGELWRFNPEGLRRCLARQFPESAIHVRGYGKALSDAAEIRGLVAEELSAVELSKHDKRFGAEVCGLAVKEGVR